MLTVIVIALVLNGVFYSFLIFSSPVNKWSKYAVYQLIAGFGEPLCEQTQLYILLKLELTRLQLLEPMKPGVLITGTFRIMGLPEFSPALAYRSIAPCSPQYTSWLRIPARRSAASCFG